MENYIFAINLLMDGASPPYQIGIKEKEIEKEIKKGKGKGKEKEKEEEKYLWIPQGKMPHRFEENDEITFYFFERSIIDCVLYVRPLSKDEELPFDACYCSDVLISDDKWQLPIYKNREKVLERICIKQSEGVWAFTIAGTMDSVLKSSIVDGEITPLVNDTKIVRPFIVDPEVVVGNRH